MYFLKVILIIFLILATAFFVAAEFAIVRVRPTRIEQLAESGDKKSQAAWKVISNLDVYLSACQLGITITALALGWVGESTIQQLLLPLFTFFGASEQLTLIISFIISFSIITFLHVVIGELAPKTLAIQKAEWVSLHTARYIILFHKILYPFIWILNGAAIKITHLLGIDAANEHDAAHTEDEIRTILNNSYTSGQINKEELNYMNNIFQFDDRLAKEIMVPRLEIAILHTDFTIEENMEIIRTEKYTRMPVAYEGDKDEIIGIIHTKEIFHAMLNEEIKSLQPFIRPAITAPETTPIRDLLKKMQRETNQMCILIDEYGGTAGLVTVEDIVEEIVGEIRDEFDYEEEPLISQIDTEHYIVDGKVLINDVNRLIAGRLDDTDVDTIGGWVFTHSPELREGFQFQQDDVQVTILNMTNHRIKRLDIRKLATQ